MQVGNDKKTKKTKRKKTNAVVENFHDIVDQDERHAEQYVTERFVSGILESPHFHSVNLLIIVIHAIVIGVRTDHSLVSVAIVILFGRITISRVFLCLNHEADVPYDIVLTTVCFRYPDVGLMISTQTTGSNAYICL